LETVLAREVDAGEAVFPEPEDVTLEVGAGFEVGLFEDKLLELVGFAFTVPLPVTLPLIPLASMAARRDEK
jgi:hypothetical protein